MIGEAGIPSRLEEEVAVVAERIGDRLRLDLSEEGTGPEHGGLRDAGGIRAQQVAGQYRPVANDRGAVSIRIRRYRVVGSVPRVRTSAPLGMVADLRVVDIEKGRLGRSRREREGRPRQVGGRLEVGRVRAGKTGKVHRDIRERCRRTRVGDHEGEPRAPRPLSVALVGVKPEGLLGRQGNGERGGRVGECRCRFAALKLPQKLSTESWHQKNHQGRQTTRS